MRAATKNADRKILRELVPLNALSGAHFEEILGKIVVEEVRAGSYLFRIDDRDMQTVFLLGGEVDLLDRNQKSSGIIKAGADRSHFPIADAQPRILSVRAVNKCVVARIDSSLLNAFLPRDESGDTGAVAAGANEDEDWMTRMIRSPAFAKIPPAKIQQLLLKMDTVRLEAGASVIRQGEAGDCFYTIRDGRCAVTRKDSPQAEDRLLAELSAGDCFGEEALVQDVNRNATVSMLTDGVLLRLAKQDFVELLQKPLVQYVGYEKAACMVDDGAIWVDVRTVDEYDRSTLEDSVNIPLASLRTEIPDLVFNVAYILCCETGQCSASAAFILSHRGFDVYVLEGGLRALPEDIFHPVPASLPAAPQVVADGQEQPVLETGRQKEGLQQSLGQRDEQESVLQQEYEQSLEKARDDLTRKNEIEHELRGQLDRMRKKLEQTSAEFENEREAARVDIDSVREELRAERSARSAERAEMASRQRELKEQLADIATEHEENIVNHSGAIEQVKLETREEEQQESEEQIDRLQQELSQAQDEISALVQREKQRRHEEHDLTADRIEQYEASLQQFQTQTTQLLQERDEALGEQQTLREKMSGLRAEVEVARGLLMQNGKGQVEDPLRLRRELNEARTNVQIAVRLRAEAEDACARLREEQEVLQKQVGNNINLGRSLNIPSPGEEQEQTNRAVFTAQAVKKQRAEPAAKSRSGKSPGTAAAAWRRAARIIGLGVMVIAGLEYGLYRFVDVSAVAFSQVQDKGSAIQPADRQGTVLVQEEPSTPGPVPPVVVDSPAPGLAGTTVLPEPARETGPRQPLPEAQGSFRDRLKDGGFAPRMIKLSAARYRMGSQGKSLNFDEGPQHEVSLSRFAISKYEVTFADYDRFARASGLQLPDDESWGRDNHPVINVSWKDTQAYVQWLSAQSGHTYHLPTEAQWEFAARAAEAASYPWDVTSEEVHANCFDCGSEWDQSSTAPIGSFPANHFGLHDMGGNVQEWTEDCFRASYNDASTDGRAMQASGCARYAVRGGAYTSPVSSLRGTSRRQYEQDTRLDNLGFRIVRAY